MDDRGYDFCVPSAPDVSDQREPLLDFTSGYVLRAIDQLPKQGPRVPWRLHQNYFKDLAMFRRAPLEDEAMTFHRVVAAGAEGAAQPMAA
jgi:hypothetical protein